MCVHQSAGAGVASLAQSSSEFGFRKISHDGQRFLLHLKTTRTTNTI
jgi:hypothetical protein